MYYFTHFQQQQHGGGEVIGVLLFEIKSYISIKNRPAELSNSNFFLISMNIFHDIILPVCEGTLRH